MHYASLHDAGPCLPSCCAALQRCTCNATTPTRPTRPFWQPRACEVRTDTWRLHQRLAVRYPQIPAESSREVRLHAARLAAKSETVSVLPQSKSVTTVRKIETRNIRESEPQSKSVAGWSGSTGCSSDTLRPQSSAVAHCENDFPRPSRLMAVTCSYETFSPSASSVAALWPLGNCRHLVSGQLLQLLRRRQMP